MPRTLSKSDFTLARTCDAKLFFRENGYPDARENNPYLTMLAYGGYMVEALAKAHHTDGIQLEYGSDLAAAAESTRNHLSRENVTLFEATLVHARRQARVDILQKRGNTVRLLEVKAKSFDGAEHLASIASGKRGVFRSSRKPHGIIAKWEGKLDDITFQTVLLEKVMPGVKITPVLVLVDTSKVAALDNIPTLFELIHRKDRDGKMRLHTARYIGTPDLLAQLDLVTEVDVTEEVAMLRDDVDAAAELFESRLDAPLAAHLTTVTRGAKCADCEFRHDGTVERDGFNDCWGEFAKPRPHMLELYHIGTAKAPDRSSLAEWMLAQKKASLLDIPVEGLTKADGAIGPIAERQRRQIEYTHRNETWVGPDLAKRVASLSGPMYFIDFETSRLALPYHKNMRPYGLVTFQWSCHTVAAPGATPSHDEWLNDADIWPNQSFAESLRNAIGDNGHVLTWSHFEGSVLKEIITDLGKFGRNVPELVEWIRDVFEHRIVDLHEWARSDYYHHGMRGRTGIKYVLDALWRSDPAMRAQFTAWTGLTADPNTDPYRSLPPLEIAGIDVSVREGTAAMNAYQEMMYGADKNNAEVRAKWSQLLRQYCGLDTLSMVLVFEHWRRAVGKGPAG